MNSKNQTEVLRYLSTVEEATLAEIYQNTKVSYYVNWSKHLSVLMTRMVRNKTVLRVKKGVFKKRSSTPFYGNKDENNPNQTKLI